MIQTLKIVNRKIIKQTFNHKGYGLVILPLTNRVKPIYAQDIINEVLK